MIKRYRVFLWVAVILIGCSIALWAVRKSPHPVERKRAVSEAHQPPIAVAPTPQIQPTVVPSVAVSPKRKFVTMGVLERNAVLNEIAKLDLTTIFQAMLDAGRVDHDLTKQLPIQSTFAGALREKTPSPEFLEQMRAFVADRSNSNFERGMLLGALGAAATKEALDLLIYAATTMGDKDPKQFAIGAIRGVGATGGAGEALSPALERVWRESSDQELLISVSVAMAEVGTSSGIELLLSAALATDGRDNVRTRAAPGALEKVFRGNAVPAVAALLSTQSSSGPATTLAGSILVQIGDATAAKVLVSWLQNADESVAPQIRRYVILTRTEALLDVWQSTTSPAVPFRSEKNRESIAAGLAEYRRNHVLVP